MKEYTLLALISVILTIVWDNLSGVKLLKKKIYYFFLFIIFLLKVLVNGALTKSIVFYRPEFFIGLRLGTIPLEGFLFGFSMVTLSIIFWESFKKPFSEKK